MICERANELINKLGLEPHPEGGYFKEVYRSSLDVESSAVGATRSAVTEIYFLLCRGQISRFHRVEHDEFWHFFEGDNLRLIDSDLETSQEVILGAEQLNYQHCIRGGCWQAAETRGEYTLVGCTVAPGFDFADFRFLDLNEVAVIQETFPEYSKFI
jgi:uncharacterized protein